MGNQRKASIEFGGSVFDENTNWEDVVRHPVGVLTAPSVRDLDAASALGALADALQGTPFETPLANAALEVIEQGNERAMACVVSAGWERAPNALERILAVVKRTPRVLSDVWLSRCFGALLRSAPSDPRVLAALEKPASVGDGHRLLEDAARYNPRWLADRLAVLRPSPAADFATWLFVAGVPAAGSTPAASVDGESARRDLLDAIAELGPPYRTALLAQYSEIAHRFPGTAKHRCLQDALARNSEMQLALLADSAKHTNEPVVKRLLRALSVGASSLHDICGREHMQQFAPFWAAVARVALTLTEEPSREFVERLARDVLSAYSYAPGEFMDKYIVRADAEAQLQENEKFDALRETVRRLASELLHAITHD